MTNKILFMLSLMCFSAQAQNQIKNDIYRTAQAIENSVFNSNASERDLREAYNLVARAYDLINNQNGPMECARLYDGQNYSGSSLSVNHNDTIYNLSAYNWNDMVSSLFVFRGCTIQMWEHKNMGGRSVIFRNEVPALSADIDNFFTSLQCTCSK